MKVVNGLLVVDYGAPDRRLQYVPQVPGPYHFVRIAIAMIRITSTENSSAGSGMNEVRPGDLPALSSSNHTAVAVRRPRLLLRDSCFSWLPQANQSFVAANVPSSVRAKEQAGGRPTFGSVRARGFDYCKLVPRLREALIAMPISSRDL